MRPVLIIAAAAALAAGSAHAQSSTATGISRAFNPAISVNTLLLGRVTDRSADPAHNGARLQETEIQFSSVVDPLWKADLVFAVHPRLDDGHEDEDAGHGGYEGDVEVATIDGQAVGWGFGLTVGKDYLPFGKHAPLHAHQFAFVDAPVAVRTFLGGHGLAGTGLRLAHDLPLPWYGDLAVYGVGAGAEIFDAESRDLAWGARWSNLFDLSLESTLEIGGSWLRGPLAPDYLQVHDEEPLAGDLDLAGVDVTWKWVSAAASRGPAATVTGELILPRPEQGAADPWGWYAHAQVRVRPTWWLGLGAGGLDRKLPHDDGAPDPDGHDVGLFAWEKVREYKANLTWVPSEFSSVRLEAAHYDDLAGDADDTVVSLQFNFTIGSHPAHLY